MLYRIFLRTFHVLDQTGTNAALIQASGGPVVLTADAKPRDPLLPP